MDTLWIKGFRIGLLLIFIVILLIIDQKTEIATSANPRIRNDRKNPPPAPSSGYMGSQDSSKLKTGLSNFGSPIYRKSLKISVSDLDSYTATTGFNEILPVFI